MGCIAIAISAGIALGDLALTSSKGINTRIGRQCLIAWVGCSVGCTAAVLAAVLAAVTAVLAAVPEVGMANFQQAMPWIGRPGWPTSSRHCFKHTKRLEWPTSAGNALDWQAKHGVQLDLPGRIPREAQGSRSELIFRSWSNACSGLLNAHLGLSQNRENQLNL